MFLAVISVRTLRFRCFLTSRVKRDCRICSPQRVTLFINQFDSYRVFSRRFRKNSNLCLSRNR